MALFIKHRHFIRRPMTSNLLIFTTIYRRRCGLITLGNEIQPVNVLDMRGDSCGLITLGNEIQLSEIFINETVSCGLITLGNEIQLCK